MGRVCEDRKGASGTMATTMHITMLLTVVPIVVMRGVVGFWGMIGYTVTNTTT
jgi:hypothetical protein